MVGSVDNIGIASAHRVDRPRSTNGADMGQPGVGRGKLRKPERRRARRLVTGGLGGQPVRCTKGDRTEKHGTDTASRSSSAINQFNEQSGRRSRVQAAAAIDIGGC